jgi:DNA primase catalytic core
MIQEASVDNVRNADIVRVIGNFLDLKKTGSKLFAKSPFSNDKSASFCVTPSLNIFKCFSSGIGGDAIKFVMLHKNASYPDALKIIADICQIALIEEAVSEEETRKRSYKQELFDLTDQAATKYQMQLHAATKEHWAKQMIAKREISEETITNFSLGYAPKDFKFLTTPFTDRAKLELAKTVGLVNTKDGRSFDFFVDRLIFPIHDFKGNIIGFGGRQADGVDGPKYINSKETEIYNKSNVLYGLFQAKNNIAKEKTAVLVEGYTDVTGLFQYGCEIAVANCGTAPLSNTQSKLLHRFANHVIICRDNDGLDAAGNEQKGTLAAIRDINTLLAEGFKVSIVILPEGEDPDSMARKTPEIKQYLLENAEDAVLWKTLKLRNKAANDPDMISESVNEVCKMLFEIKDDIKQAHYVKTCSGLMKQPIKVFKDTMTKFIKKAEIKSENTGVAKAEDAEIMGLPDGADYSQYFTLGFVIHENSVYFKGREKFFKGSNYKITPLFHVYGKTDNKRLCEVISEYGKKKIIDFDTSDFVQMAKFEGKLLDEGNFTFTADVTANHFKLFRNSIMEQFIMAYELKSLGWQPEGFFAYADCVFHGGILKRANDYGIIQLETGVKTESEYMEDVKHFYSPSASVMHKFSREGDDLYENDRYLVYKKATVDITSWMKQLRKVYGATKSTTGIAFVIASIFRDITMKKKGFFPLFFLSGEKGSGKSKFGESMVALFTHKQEPFDLNSGTKVALSRRLARISNISVMFEEYNDGVEDTVFQMLKGAYDGRGREMGKATGDNRTTTTKVNCGLILLSQYLSSRDDNSLTSRSVIENFIKPHESFTTAQIEDYSLLKSWEEHGLSSLLVEILQHRELIEEKTQETYAAISKKMKAELKGKDYQERMMENYIAMLVPITILKNLLRFPFDEKEVWDQFKEAIIASSDLIIESEGLAEFWHTLEFLLDTKRIIKGHQFEIEMPLMVKLQTRKGEADLEVKLNGQKRVLYLRLNAVHQLYHKEVSTRDSVEVIGENTLKNYFRSKKYFIGSVKSKRFEDTSTSAYLFDYDMMHDSNILNLIRGAGDDEIFSNDNNKSPEEGDNLPEWLKQ